MVTKTQLDRLASRVERLGAAVNSLDAVAVPIFAGETEQEAIAHYEKMRGPIKPGTPIEFNRGSPGETREEGMKRPANCLLFFNAHQLDEMIKGAAIPLAEWLPRIRQGAAAAIQKRDGTYQTRGSESVEDKD